MSSEQYLWKKADKFVWTGDVEALKTFFKALGCTGIWTKVKHGWKFTHKDFVCTWYTNTKTLFPQGKNEVVIRKRLNDALDTPVSLEEQSKAEKQPSVPIEQKENSDNAEVCDGLHCGKDIASLIRSKLEKWVNEEACITIVTPFLDEVGLKFIMSNLSQKGSFCIYTREYCGWNKKIDKVLAVTEHSSQWIAENREKIIALKCQPSFHAKFLAGEYSHKVELVVTSCNMTKEHLESEQLETVMQFECTLELFQKNWIEPLEKIGEDKVNFLGMDSLGKALPK